MTRHTPSPTANAQDVTATHTPGPWEVESPMDGELWIVEAGKQAYEWRVIAGCPFPDERSDIPRKQVEANARLFSAAPDLLIALSWFINDIDGTHTVMVDFDANVTRARAAIEKATAL